MSLRHVDRAAPGNTLTVTVSQLTLLLLHNYTSHFIITTDYVTYSSHVLLEFCYSLFGVYEIRCVKILDHRFRTGCKPDGVAVGSEMTEPHVYVQNQQRADLHPPPRCSEGVSSSDPADSTLINCAVNQTTGPGRPEPGPVRYHVGVDP